MVYVHKGGTTLLLMETLDEQFLGNTVSPNPGDTIVYGTLWPRIGAYFLDFLVLAPVSMGLTYANVLYWKSTFLVIPIFLIVMSYRPVLEHLYGYSLGKKWLGMMVINQEGDSPTWTQAILRNVFMLAINFFSLVLTILLFSQPGFSEVQNYTEYTLFVAQHQQYNWLQSTLSLIFVIDAIVLWRDRQKRSLHDQIARTWVVKS